MKEQWRETVKLPCDDGNLEISVDPQGGLMHLWGSGEDGFLIRGSFSAQQLEHAIALLTRAKDILETGVGGLT